MKAFILIICTIISGVVIIACATTRADDNFSGSNSAITAPDSKTPNNGKRAPVIVELFTSEGCSSCPPADGNLKMLIETQPVAGAEIIALSEHVDYWNRLGWADPFSAAQFSGRQGEYSDFFKQNGNVYTPQMIVDGTRQFAGGNMRDALKQIAEAAKVQKGEVEIEKIKDEGNTLSVKVRTANLPKLSNGETRIVLLAVTEKDLISNVSRGENGGQRLPHTAVTRYLQNIGSAVGAGSDLTADITLDKKWKRDNLSIVAFVQETGSRKIIGAGKIDLQK